MRYLAKKKKKKKKKKHAYSLGHHKNGICEHLLLATLYTEKTLFSLLTYQTCFRKRQSLLEMLISLNPEGGGGWYGNPTHPTNRSKNKKSAIGADNSFATL